MSTSLLKLNLVDGSVSFSFTPEAARELKAAIAILMSSLKTAATTGTPDAKRSPQKPMEYCHTGDVFLEIFCNPNIWPSPFAAKVLLTLRDEHLRLTTEAELTQIVEDLNLYLEEHCEAGSLRSPGFTP
ncbi:hypothetical protein ACQ4M4_08520 [Leptolyngbya sp. AN02str]|uniref:hypothetical protein n=1 Tax=Leptolyngbya sp. AN02str TaxID=3423363 RepID=UPI003D31A96E